MPCPVLCVVCKVALILILLGAGFVRNEIPLLSKNLNTMLEEGKRQYNLVRAKTTIPTLGSCWKRAVNHLHDGCKHLDDRTQSDVALGFANCFLEGAGISRYDCHDSLEKEVCMKAMPDRTFMAYTEFFTHTQSMCFFIMSQLWHEETEETIDRLSVSAADVARQLEATEELQTELLNYQRQSVTIQQELLDNGHSLDKMLHESRDSLSLIFTEFRSSTLEQQRLLGMVFHHLSALQSWVVGEVSWLDSIAFYIPSFAFVFFLTSAQRSANARIPSYLVLILAAMIERFIAYVLLQADNDHNNFQPIEVLNERLNWWIWMIRRFSVFGIGTILVYILYQYHDREEVMHQLLQQIQSQNKELLKYIGLHGIQADSQSPSQSLNNDEPDGLGYIALPVVSSPSSVGCAPWTSSHLSESGSVKVIASTYNCNSHSGISDISRDTSSSHSPSTNVDTHLYEQNARIFTALEEPLVERKSEEDISEGLISSIHFSSTPIKKSVKKPVHVKGSSSPRYNLRKSRLTSPTT